MKLPPELLQIICEYADVKCRNGVYMSQIAKTDPRRDILQKIKQIQVNNYIKRAFVILPKCIIVCFSDNYSFIPTQFDVYYTYLFNWDTPHDNETRTIYYYVNSLDLIFDNLKTFTEYIIEYDPVTYPLIRKQNM